jgi:hypothetical protein
MVINMFKRKLLIDCYLFNVEGNLLVLAYVHSIFPPSRLHLALSFIMACTLVHLFVLFSNAYKT